MSDSADVTPEQRRPPQQWPSYPKNYGPYPPQGHPYPPQNTPPPSPRKRRRWPFVLGGMFATLVLLIVIAAIAAPNAPTGSSVPASRTSGGGATNANPANLPLVTAGPPKTITARDWAKIAKDPDSHQGEAIIVYGQVKQFDSATGRNAFRANVDGVPHKASYGYVDYDTNTFMDANGTDLRDLVQDDLFKAEVVVGGSLSYETSLGGSMTVPLLKITKITATGSAK